MDVVPSLRVRARLALIKNDFVTSHAFIHSFIRLAPPPATLVGACARWTANPR